MAFKALLLTTLCQGIGGSMYNYKTAIEQCKEHGGLASGKHFLEIIERNLEIDLSLDEGESVWVSGHVKYSKLIAWHGCYTEDRQKIQKHKLKENNIIYDCLEYCSSLNDITHIGLQNSWCYCIKKGFMTHFKVKPDDICEPHVLEPSYVAKNIDPLSSRAVNINVYLIINHGNMFWDPPISDSHDQCVYIKIDGKQPRYGTESCSSQTKGYICTSSASRSLNKTCDKYHPTEYPFCVVDKPITWRDAFQECGAYSGKLNQYISDDTKRAILTSHKQTYWTGIFRSFSIIERNVSDDISVCVSLKKVASKLVLDPTDCLSQKGFICEDSFTKVTVPTTVKATSKSVQDKNNDYTTYVPSENTAYSQTHFKISTNFTLAKNVDSDSRFTNIYISSGVGFIAVIFAVGITFLIVRKRQKCCERKPHDKNCHKNNAKGAVIDLDINVKYASVSKAQGNELVHHHNVEIEGEYASPLDDMMQSNIPDCEYDRADMNAPGTFNGNSKAVNVMKNETNLYDVHTGKARDTGTDEYDHIGNVGPQRLVKAVDVIYNTMTEESDTYNVLISNCKINLADLTPAKQANATCDTYDKLG